jgi:hypothetical protein
MQMVPSCSIFETSCRSLGNKTRDSDHDKASERIKTFLVPKADQVVLHFGTRAFHPYPLERREDEPSLWVLLVAL